MKNIYVFLLIVLSNQVQAGLFGKEEINTIAIKQEIVHLIDQLKLDEAEKVYQDKVTSGADWCLDYYNGGKCSRSVKEAPVKEFEKIFSKARLCVPAAIRCNSEDIDKTEADKCIETMEDNCRLSRPEYTNHPYPHQKILDNIKSRLPNLKFSSTNTSNELKEAYNKCLENQKWGYVVNERSKDSKIMFHNKIKEKIVGNYDTETDCVEAKSNFKPDPNIEITGGCLKRYIGKNINVSLWEAAIAYRNENNISENKLTFSSKELCNSNIKTTKEYFITNHYSEKLKVTISPYKSKDESRFTSECKEIKFLACEANTNSYNQAELND